MALLAVLAAGFVVALAGKAAGGPEPLAKWGYPAATLAFLLSAAHGAPILALVSRLGRGLWGIPLRRAAELFALAGLVTAPLFVLLLLQLPSWEGRPSLWFDWPGAPRVWDSVAMVLFSLLGVGLLGLSCRPDLAAPSAGRSGRPRWGWVGGARQWRAQMLGVVALGGLYLMLYVFIHLLVSSDLALSLTPGWRSAVIPPYHAISGFQAGVAATVLAAAALRRFGGPGPGIEPGAFHAAGKLLLALALLWFYFVWSEFLTFWYGRMPRERWLLELLMFGPYFGPFLLAVGCNLLLPLGLLIWNPIRNSIGGPTIVAAIVLLGSFADRVRIYVAAWSVAGPPERGHELARRGPGPGPLSPDVGPLPATHFPDLLDLLVMVGGPAAVLLLYLLALRVVPAVSRWEAGWGGLLRDERAYLKARVQVIGRPS